MFAWCRAARAQIAERITALSVQPHHIHGCCHPEKRALTGVMSTHYGVEAGPASKVVCMLEHHTSVDWVGVGMCLGVYRAVVLL
jgi:hypothetical protein